MTTHGTPTEETFKHYEPKAIRSAPVTPCDSESTWSTSWSQHYDLPGYDTGYDKNHCHIITSFKLRLHRAVIYCGKQYFLEFLWNVVGKSLIIV
ncbi:hypothetical protein K1T71_004422 [Dendrolimus kikuchii]|uniref:Uncharacterized protein n=1 Tax=Dendrolimus kikuchii TaxID=765133 RepID=A0ACC1D7G6_9NEOP|nr:hypothetical protein K1T71_004422 [Dendrolimus kikuchii]